MGGGEGGLELFIKCDILRYHYVCSSDSVLEVYEISGLLVGHADEYATD